MTPSDQHGLRRCRCGAEPRVERNASIAEGAVWAVRCHKFCGDDTHWQMSAAEAARRWNAGLVRGANGGNGAASDDLLFSTALAN